MVKFTCRRCKREQIDELETHQKDDPESYGYLRSIKPPQGWQEIPYSTLLCPDCAKAYVLFMAGEDGGVEK